MIFVSAPRIHHPSGGVNVDENIATGKKSQREMATVFGLVHSEFEYLGFFFSGCKTCIYNSRKRKLNCISQWSIAVRELYFCCVGPHQGGVYGRLHLPEGIVLIST